ncbi:DUF6372 family protein [Kitasatospora viridis]|uniref:Uncharacterized protein n=1 Tax=Kitasatospora viridis TaxID=281105 RepID=A0A561SA45_9ACTN|nr:DUF6372 family protein [Kitasatospora viridis]TWF71749.1 hypothetical protein FHX73_18120 [Kitasatospora viridis]
MSDKAEDHPDVQRLLAAYQRLQETSLTLLALTAQISDLGPYGTEELPDALTALRSLVEQEFYVHELAEVLRSVSCAYTVDPLAALRLGGEDPLALTGAIMMIRGTLSQLDELGELFQLPVLTVKLPVDLGWEQRQPGGCRCACQFFHQAPGVCLRAGQPGLFVRVVSRQVFSPEPAEVETGMVVVCLDCYQAIAARQDGVASGQQ